MSEKKSLQLYIRSGTVQDSIEQTLKDRSGDFTTSLLTVINGNPVLQECDPQEVVRTALKAASMRLPIDPNLGLAYIIPYANKKKIQENYTDSKGALRVRDKWETKYEPQLQIGWRGFVQLALRTKQYLRINTSDVREGEYGGKDRMTGDIKFNWIEDDVERAKKPVIGYIGFFRLVGGFEKILYMTAEELEAHARKYSKSYSKGNGVWKDQREGMSLKTVIKLLLSKYGPQSTEIQQALRSDQAAMGDEDTYDYVDNDRSNRPKEAPGTAPDQPAHANTPEAEVVDPPAPDNVDQTPKQPTEAEAPQAPPAKPVPPKKSVKEQLAERGWTKPKGGNDEPKSTTVQPSASTRSDTRNSDEDSSTESGVGTATTDTAA